MKQLVSQLIMDNKYIERLFQDLSEYGTSYSIRNLHYMAQFADEFCLDEIMHQPGAQIPWRTTIEIMQKSKSHEEMLYYINETYKNGWSRSMVIIRIADEFTYDEIGLQLATQIPWWTIILIITKSNSHSEMLYYINETYKNG